MNPISQRSRRRQLKLAGLASLAIAVAGGISPLSAAADQDEAKPSDDRQEHAEKRLEYMVTAMSRYSVFEIDSEGELQPAELVQTPLLRWSNPHSNAQDGLLVAYTRGGRPALLAQIAVYTSKRTIHEFHPCSAEVVEMKRDDRPLWRSADARIEFRDVPEAAAAAATETLRTPQMRELATRFKVFDHHGWREKVRHELRLLRQPTYRYQDAESGIIDGAVFTFVLGTDPEANLLLELYESESGPKWRYGFNPMTIYELEAYLGEDLVWHKPERRMFGASNASQYVYPYQPHPDDISLEGLMPSQRR